MTEANHSKTTFFELVSALSTAFVTARHDELSVVMPLHSSDGLLGMFGIDLVRAHYVWSAEEVAALQLVAGNICGSLLRGRAEQQLRTLALYDSVTELPNRRYLGAFSAT